MDDATGPTPVDTALELSLTAHDAVGSAGLPQLAREWHARVESAEVSEQVAARLITVGAVYPSDAVLWLGRTHLDLARSPARSVRVVVDDDALPGHGLMLVGTLAETLGRSADVPVETARLLVELLDRQPS